MDRPNDILYFITPLESLTRNIQYSSGIAKKFRSALAGQWTFSRPALELQPAAAFPDCTRRKFAIPPLT
jgi:hypothetical protein